MASSGQHKATVILDGKSDGLDKAARGASKRVGELEGTVEKLQEELAKATKRLDEQTAAMQRSAQRTAEQAAATKAASQRQNELAAAARRAQAEQAAAAKVQAAELARRKAQEEQSMATRRAAAAFDVDAARRQREALQATRAVTRDSSRAHLAAIEREQAARLRQIEVERLGARSTADSMRLSSQADQVRHDARMKRLAVERAAQQGGGGIGGIGAAQLTQLAGGATVAALAVDKLASRTVALGSVQANLPFSIDKARQATRGLVSDYDLMRQAITANRLGVASSSEEFARAAETAVKLGTAVGNDATQSLDDFVNGLGRGSTEVLDNLGIMLRAEEAQKLYATSLGKTTKELTDAEKRQAVITVGLERGAEMADKTAKSVDGMASAWERAKVSISNTADAVLQFDENLASLSEETLKSLGFTGKQAEETTSRVWQSLKEGVADAASMGISKQIRDIGTAYDQLTGSVDELVVISERGKPEMTFLTLFLRQQGDLAEKAAKSWDLVSGSVENTLWRTREAQKVEEAGLAKERERLLLDQRDASNKYEADKAAEAAKERRAKGEKARAAYMETTRAEMQLAIDNVKREQEMQGVRESTAEERMATLEDLGLAEQALGQFEIEHARTQAELFAAATSYNAALQASTVRRLEAEKAAKLEAAQIDKETTKRLDEEIDRARDRDLAMAEIANAKALREAELPAELGPVANGRQYNRAQKRADAKEVDPMQQLEIETDAKLRLLDVQAKAANDVVAKAQIADEREATIHDLKMARLDAEKAKRLEGQATIQEVSEKGASLALGLAEVGLRAAIMEEGSVKRKVAAVAKAQAFEFGVIQGPKELILAAIAAASYNPVGVALHLANAAQAFGFAAAMGVVAGATGGFSSSPKAAAGGPSAAGFGSGGGASAGGSRGGGSSSSGSSSSQSQIPASPEPTVPAAAAAAAGGGQKAGNTYNFYGGVYANDTKEFAKKLDRDTRDLAYSDRRVSNG